MISASGVSAAAAAAPPSRRHLPRWSTSRCSPCASGAAAAAPHRALRGAAPRPGAAPTPPERGTAPSGWRAGEGTASGCEVGSCRIWDFSRRGRGAGTAKAIWAPPFQKRSCRETGTQTGDIGGKTDLSPPVNQLTSLEALPFSLLESLRMRPVKRDCGDSCPGCRTLFRFLCSLESSIIVTLSKGVP